MKCHNCKVILAEHAEKGCESFEMDAPNYQASWGELAGWLKEAESDGGEVNAHELLLYMRELTRRHRKAVSLKLHITPAVIGEGVEAHFKEFPDCSYNCIHMDKFVAMWKGTIQRAKPNTELGCRAFRYVLVTGERDW